jgi:hypothetical protein
LTIFPQDFGGKTYLKHWRLKTQKKTREVFVQHIFSQTNKKRSFFGENTLKNQILFLAFAKKISNNHLIFFFLDSREIQ